MAKYYYSIKSLVLQDCLENFADFYYEYYKEYLMPTHAFIHIDVPHFLTREKSLPDLLALPVSPWDCQKFQEHC